MSLAGRIEGRGVVGAAGKELGPRCEQQADASRGQVGLLASCWPPIPSLFRACSEPPSQAQAYRETVKMVRHHAFVKVHNMGYEAQCGRMVPVVSPYSVTTYDTPGSPGTGVPAPFTPVSLVTYRREFFSRKSPW